MIEKLGVPSRLFQLTLTELESFGMPIEAVKFIPKAKPAMPREEEWKRVYDNGGSLLTYADEEYPDRLREIYDAPAVLWIRGNRALFSRPSLAVIGTRHPTPYGAGMAEVLSRDLPCASSSF